MPLEWISGHLLYALVDHADGRRGRLCVRGTRRFTMRLGTVGPTITLALDLLGAAVAPGAQARVWLRRE